MPVEGVNSNKGLNARVSGEAPLAPSKTVATHTDSSLKSAGSKSDDAFDCFACVKYYASTAVNGIYSLCEFVYNFLFGAQVPEKKEEKPKVEEKPKTAAPKEESKAEKTEDKPIVPSTHVAVSTETPASPKTKSALEAIKEAEELMANLAEEELDEQPTVAKEEPKKEEEMPAPSEASVETPVVETPAAKVKGDPKIIKILQDNFVMYKPETIKKLKETPVVEAKPVEVVPTKADLAKTVLVRQQSTEIVTARLLQLQANFDAAKASALAKIAQGKDDASDIATQFLDRIGQAEETKNKEEIVKGTKEHNRFSGTFTFEIRQAANNRAERDNATRLQALKVEIEKIKSPQEFFAAQWPKPKAEHDQETIAKLQANFVAAKAVAETQINTKQKSAVVIATEFLKQVLTESIGKKPEASKYSETVLMPFFFAANENNDRAMLLVALQTLKSPEDFFKK